MSAIPEQDSPQQSPLTDETVQTLREWSEERRYLFGQWLAQHDDAFQSIMDEVETQYPGGGALLMAKLDELTQDEADTDSEDEPTPVSAQSTSAQKPPRIGPASGRKLLRMLSKHGVIPIDGSRHIRVDHSSSGMKSGFGIHSGDEYAPHFVKMIFRQLGIVPGTKKT